MTRRQDLHKRKVLPREERREMILDAALEIFARHGYEIADVDDIARQAGIGKGTIYRQFPSKRHLFVAVIDRGFDQLQERMQQLCTLQRSFDDTVAVGLKLHVDFFVENPKYWRLLMLEHPHERPDVSDATFRGHQCCEEYLVDGIKAGISAGFFKKVDPQFAAHSLMAMAALIVEKCLHGKRDTRRKDIRSAVDIFLRGINK